MKTVRYIHKIDVYGNERLPRFRDAKIDTEFVKMYESVITTLLRLPDCPANLITYLSHKMTEENVVHHNKFTRESFNKFIYKLWYDEYKQNGVENAHEEATAKQYSDHTIKKAFSVLTDKGLLIPQTRGMFVVNPEYFFKKSDKDRLDKIKVVLEMKSGVRDVNMQIIGE